MRVGAKAAVMAALMCFASSPAASTTLDDVKARGHLTCGVARIVPGFSMADSKGHWSGFDIDICRALAAAIFADPNKIEVSHIPSKRAGAALQAGEIDVLTSSSGLDLDREGAPDTTLAAITHFDEQAFLVRKSLGIASALELSQAKVCVEAGTVTEQNVATFFRSRKMPYEPILLDTVQAAAQAYQSERCGALSAETLHLYAMQRSLGQADDHMVLPERIAKTPHGPCVSPGDQQWVELVRWVVFALINAEELGVTSSNADDMKQAAKAQVRRLLGVEGAYGQKLGLDTDWAYHAIKYVGNYGEIFERHLGNGSPFKLPRGFNALWNNGGILYAPPVR